MRIPVTEKIFGRHPESRLLFAPGQGKYLGATPNRVCFLRLATLPMPRGEGPATNVGAPCPRASIWKSLQRRGRRKYPQPAAAASRQLRVASCKNGQKQVPRPKRRRAYRQRFIVYVIGVRTYSHWLERISPLIIDQAVNDHMSTNSYLLSGRPSSQSTSHSGQHCPPVCEARRNLDWR
jgi:hypothetical protein